MSKTLYQHHEEIVQKLKEKGEPIFNPTHRSAINEYRSLPDVYVKSMKFPSEEFNCGCPVEGQDGTYSICGEHLTWVISGLKFEELGLCDPIVETENYRRLHEKPARKAELEKCLSSIESEMDKIRKIFDSVN